MWFKLNQTGDGTGMGKIRNRGRNDTKKSLFRQGNVVGDRHEQREVRGLVQEVEYRKSSTEKYNLDWFKPSGRQQDIVDAIDQYDWVGVQAPSGCGKTTTVVWKALSLLGKGYRKIVFVKNPTEVGTDMLGYLTGDKNDKMQAHFEAMRGVFLDFMNKGKLESDEKNGNIVFNNVKASKILEYLRQYKECDELVGSVSIKNWINYISNLNVIKQKKRKLRN